MVTVKNIVENDYILCEMFGMKMFKVLWSCFYCINVYMYCSCISFKIQIYFDPATDKQPYITMTHSIKHT